MSSLINYYVSNNSICTSNDINADVKMTLPADTNYYASNNPTGWFHDIGCETVGKRPVRKSYHVGSCSKVTPTNTVQPGTWDCSQPKWNKNCR